MIVGCGAERDLLASDFLLRRSTMDLCKADGPIGEFGLFGKDRAGILGRRTLLAVLSDLRRFGYSSPVGIITLALTSFGLPHLRALGVGWAGKENSGPWGLLPTFSGKVESAAQIKEVALTLTLLEPRRS